MDVTDYLNEIARGSYDATQENFDGSDLSTEQAYDATEVENYLAVNKRYPRGAARKMADRIVRNPRGLQAVKAEMRNAGLAGGFEMRTAQGLNVSAIFDIKVKRLTANLTQDLPVPIFGAFDLANKYNSVLQLPSGISVTALSNGVIGNENVLLISYSDGVKTDQVQISIDQYAYPSFLSACLTSRFVASQLRYSISDTTPLGLQQLNKKFIWYNNSMFGDENKNNFPLSGAKTPYQNQPGIVDLQGTFNVNAQITWILTLQSNAAQEVTLNCTVTSVDKGLA